MAAIHVEKVSQASIDSENSDLDPDLSDEEASLSDETRQRLSDAEGEDSSEDESHSAEDNAPSKSGMANIIAKILAKDTSSSNRALLAKGKTNREILKDITKRRKERGDKNDATNEDGEEKVKSNNNEVIKLEQKKLWESMARRRPSEMDLPKETKLRRIATQGMVQLFQSVHEHQKLLNQKMASVGPSERKKDKVVAEFTKGKFLDLLKSKKSAESKVKDNEAGSGGNPKWKILQDDFMMGARMKDWDKDEDEDSHEDSDNFEGGNAVSGTDSRHIRGMDVSDDDDSE